MNNRWSLLTLVTLVFFGTSLARGQQEQWLQYRSARWDDISGMVGPTVMRSLMFSASKPSMVSLPEFIDDKQQFARWTSPLAKNGGIWIALDRTTKDGYIDRLFIDSDGDGHLDDETAATAYQADQNFSKFGPVKVVLAGEDGPLIYHLNFRLYNLVGMRDLIYFPGCWYEGTIKVGGQNKFCILFDQNANGIFNDISKRPYEGDQIRISNEQDYKLRKVSQYMGVEINNQTTEPEWTQTHNLGKYLEIDGKWYRPEIAQDGAYIKLTAADDLVLGKLHLTESVTKIALFNDDGFVYLEPENGEAELPAGKYDLYQWTLQRRDDQGNLWQLQGNGMTRNGAIKVGANGETALKIGEPLNSEITVNQINGTSYLINQNLRGQMGEMISITRNGTLPAAPKIHIKNADGTFNASLSLEYG